MMEIMDALLWDISIIRQLADNIQRIIICQFTDS